MSSPRSAAATGQAVTRALWFLLGVLLVLIFDDVSAQTRTLTPCPSEDERFLVDKNFPTRQLVPGSVGAFRAVQTVATSEWGKASAGPDAYQVTLWESVAGGSGGGADYVLTLARPYEWFQVLWKGSTAGAGWGAYLRSDGGQTRLVVIHRSGDGECNACAQSIDVERHRWDGTKHVLTKEATYRTRCKY